MRKEEITRLFSGRVRPRSGDGWSWISGRVHEIRLRTGAPLQLDLPEGRVFSGRGRDGPDRDPGQGDAG